MMMGPAGPDELGPVEPLGAPSDPLRPTGRPDATQALAESKAQMAATGRRILRAAGVVLAVVALLAVAFFVVTGLLPKPDL